MDESCVFFLRAYAWWVLLQCWATLLFSDHRGLSLDQDFAVVGNALVAKLGRSSVVLSRSRTGSQWVGACSGRRQTFAGTTCYQAPRQTTEAVSRRNHNTRLPPRRRQSFHWLASRGRKTFPARSGLPLNTSLGEEFSPGRGGCSERVEVRP